MVWLEKAVVPLIAIEQSVAVTSALAADSASALQAIDA
jgi:hypothetical protein